MPLRLSEAANRIGKTVVYRPPGTGSEQRSEYGVITSVTEDFVFVRYEGDEHSKATSPWMLTFWGPA